MRCVIFTGPKNYDINELYQRQKDDYIIGADQGAAYLAQYNLSFDLAIGDFDSTSKEDMVLIEQYAQIITKYPSQKDFTDTFLAVQEALKQGYKEIIIYGGIGKRLDHSYANIQLLRQGNITLITNHEKIYLLSPGKHTIQNNYSYISFFAIEDVINLSLTGFKYELQNVELPVGDPLCISNQKEGVVAFDLGLLLVIHQNE